MIQAYVFGRNPKYRMLLKNKPEIFNEIPWVVDEEKLENIKFDLIDLDTETKSLKSYFHSTPDISGIVLRQSPEKIP